MDTNKLVKAAEQASMEAGTQARLDNKGRSFIGGIIVRAEARAATVAVLRELVTSFGEEYLNGGDLQDLADEIEEST